MDSKPELEVKVKKKPVRKITKENDNENEWINPITGEIGSGFISIKGARYVKGTEFVTMFQPGLIHLAGLCLTPTENRVIFLLLGRMGYKNYCRIAGKSIAKALNISEPAASIAIKALRQHKLVVLHQDPEEPERQVLRVSASLAWRGNAGDFAADQQKPLIRFKKESQAEKAEQESPQDQGENK